MCGIAGVLADTGAPPASLEVLRRMISVLRHRGPDGYGLYRDERIGLGHARLSIIDLSGGAQPIHNEDESIWVVFNGEIFNYVELRGQLEGRGHRFYTRTDTEIIVHAYEEYGERAWRRFNGQFAFSLWDRLRQRMWLVRDRVGILPLYYSQLTDRVAFASEAKALFAGGCVRPQLNGPGLVEIFTRWSVPSPATAFKGVCTVPPATAICFDERLHACSDRYWSPRLVTDGQTGEFTSGEAAEALGERLDSAIRLRLRADVPVGAYLSGGLDSSVIAQCIRKADSSPLETFAVRFVDPAFDETAEQRRMARLLRTNHHEILCGAEQIHDALPEVVWHCETPLLRTAPVPLFLLSKLVRDSRMKVVLTGEGADELLAGYHIFKENKIRRFWARQPESQVRPMLLSRLYHYIAGGQQHTRLWQQFFRRDLTNIDDPFYSHRVRWENTGWSRRFLAQHLKEGHEPAEMDGALEKALPQGWHAWEPLARAQLIEMTTLLSSYLLCSQGDRVAMANGVEVRYPFLDPDVVDFCCGLPGRLKLQGLRDKVALRALARRDLPEEIWRRPKQPYRAPMTQALFAGGRDGYVGELLSRAYLERYGLVDVPACLRLIGKAVANQGRMAGEREEMALVGVLTLQSLAYLYLERFDQRVAERRSALDEVRPTVLEDRLRCAAAQRIGG